ncbi:HD domain-containing phosphohydrolase [Anaerostipes hadrus]|uniref:HD domain-containing phosphohydrolase n=1 Tax=Anaerostipes hadrus TaxID=649756 RepID=UPI001FC7DDF8|nr:HD domain-containing phosphohydrolase [Anaerostipes hadrus]
MIRKPYKTNKNISRLFYILMMIIFVWFIGIQILGPDEQFFDQSGHSIIYNGTFTWKKSDGTKQNISVPGRYKVPAKQTMIITTTLPDDYNENVIAIRSSLQDVRFYIDGKLRKEYNAKSLHRFGKNSASRYIFCNTSSADAGKELCLELTTYTSNYSGVVNTIYCGDQMQIWSYIFNHNFSVTVIESFIFFASIVTILFSIALGIVYKTKFNMEYLGWCMLMGSVWMIGESKMRQLLVPNASGLATSCFIMLMLCPLPISLYVNNLQKGKYKKIFQSICFIALLNFIICTILHLTGIADYIETMPAAHAILIITFLAVIITFLIGYWNHRSRSDCLLFFGLLITMLSVIFEAISVYYKVSVSGVFVGIAILILLFMNVIYTIHIIRDIIKHQQQEELDKRKKNIEEMSLQLMQMLSTTIEAKDEYTKGHSHRVAEYSVLIARELGWNEKELSNLKNAAHLHDIGKIAIPDTILNKPSKLSEEEFSIIKEHTIIGANILKNISLIDHVQEIVRNHHERYDGNGYPDGLKGKEIPLHARIVAVADSYDAMSSQRIYRNQLPPEKIIQELENNKGTQFDPEITDIFLKLLSEDRIHVKEDHLSITENTQIPEAEIEMSQFISDIMSTIRTQKTKENLDFLTGLPTRNKGEQAIAQLMKHHSGCLVFMDMDNLKTINDIYGHKAGDRVLKLLGNLLLEYSSECLVCRLGGDEFLLFMPDADQNSITEVITAIFKKFNTRKEQDPELHAAHPFLPDYICAILEILLTNVIQKLIKHYIS